MPRRVQVRSPESWRAIFHVDGAERSVPLTGLTIKDLHLPAHGLYSVWLLHDGKPIHAVPLWLLRENEEPPL